MRDIKCKKKYVKVFIKNVKMSHKNLKMSKHKKFECQNTQKSKKCQMSKTPSSPPILKWLFRIQCILVSSELVISVFQNVITSEYQNFCCVKILDCCVGILDGKFFCQQFFSFNILLQTIFSRLLICASNFFNDF